MRRYGQVIALPVWDNLSSPAITILIWPWRSHLVIAALFNLPSVGRRLDVPASGCSYVRVVQSGCLRRLGYLWLSWLMIEERLFPFTRGKRCFQKHIDKASWDKLNYFNLMEWHIMKWIKEPIEQSFYRHSQVVTQQLSNRLLRSNFGEINKKLILLLSKGALNLKK